MFFSRRGWSSQSFYEIVNENLTWISSNGDYVSLCLYLRPPWPRSTLCLCGRQLSILNGNILLVFSKTFSDRQKSSKFAAPAGNKSYVDLSKWWLWEPAETSHQIPPQKCLWIVRGSTPSDHHKQKNENIIVESISGLNSTIRALITAAIHHNIRKTHFAPLQSGFWVFSTSDFSNLIRFSKSREKTTQKPCSTFFSTPKTRKARAKRVFRKTRFGRVITLDGLL